MCSWHPGEERRFQVNTIIESRGLYGLFCLAHSLKHPDCLCGQKQFHAHIQIVHWDQTAHEIRGQMKLEGKMCKVGEITFYCFFRSSSHFLLSLGNLLPRDKGLWEKIDWLIDWLARLLMSFTVYSAMHHILCFLWSLPKLIAPCSSSHFYVVWENTLWLITYCRGSALQPNNFDVLENFIWMDSMGILK